MIIRLADSSPQRRAVIYQHKAGKMKTRVGDIFAKEDPRDGNLPPVTSGTQIDPIGKIATLRGQPGDRERDDPNDEKAAHRDPAGANQMSHQIEDVTTSDEIGAVTLPSSKRLRIRLPPLFDLFPDVDPPINPHYNALRFDQAKRITAFCKFDCKTYKRISKCDFAYFCAIVAPEAPLIKFQTIVDWGSWVFPFDDQMDEGGLSKDPQGAQELLDCMLSIIRDDASEFTHKERPLIVQWHDRIWRQLCKSSQSGVQRRYARAMTEYAVGAHEHVEYSAREQIPGPEEMLKTRSSSAGVTPLMALYEYANQLRIPDEVFQHPVMQELQDLGSDFVAIANDMLSYPKEEANGVPHNLVASYRMRGLDAQAAFDAVGAMLDSRKIRWSHATRALPSWGEEVDAQVLKYIEGISNIVKANLHWSFRSARYFPNGLEVKTSSIVEVSEDPEYVQKSHT